MPITKRGHPRLRGDIRTAIVRIRANNPGIGPDAILGKLKKPPYKIEPLPARATVAKVIQDWEKLPPEVRIREMPFQWLRLEEARIPWEAGCFILECARIMQEKSVSYAVYLLELLDEYRADPKAFGERFRAEFGITDDVIIRALPQDEAEFRQNVQESFIFTNRMATWCWRVHLAAPDLDAEHVLLLAQDYVEQEQAQDLLIEQPEMNTVASDSWLTFRPDNKERPDLADKYDTAIFLGLVPPTPELLEAYQQTLATQTELESEGRVEGRVEGRGLAAARAKFMRSYVKQEPEEPTVPLETVETPPKAERTRKGAKK